MSPGNEVVTIPRLTRVFKTTWALRPTSGLRVQDLFHCTDRKVLYRWSGSAWEAMTIYSGSGVAANIPTAGDLPNDSIYFETDTGLLKQIQSGAWQQISISDSGEGFITILLFNYHSIVQGTWDVVIDAQCFLNGYFRNTSSADGDELTFEATLQKGTYSLRIIHSKGAAHGILKVDIGGNLVTTLDCYASGDARNQIHTETGIVIAASGRKTIRYYIDGKNGSSSDYYVLASMMALWRTA